MQFLTINEELTFLKKRYQIMTNLESIVSKLGYIKVEPDYFEPYERFIEMNKRVPKETMVKLIQNDGTISILRPDITTNIIKQVIPKWSNDALLKLFYLAKTFSQKPNFPIKEDWNFGVELLGKQENAELEIVKIMLSIFENFKLDYMIEVGNQKFLNILLSRLNLSDDDTKNLKQIIDSKNQSELAVFANKLVESNDKYILLNIFNLEGSLNEIINKLEKLKIDSSLQNALNEFKLIDHYLKQNKLIDKIAYDLSLISKYDYYDGLTFKGYLRNVSYPILNGGRYDPLTKAFGNQISAIGFSINLNELIKEVINL